MRGGSRNRATTKITVGGYYDRDLHLRYSKVSGSGSKNNNNNKNINNNHNNSNNDSNDNNDENSNNDNNNDNNMTARGLSPIKNSNFLKLFSAGGSFRVSSIVLRGTFIIINDNANIATSIFKRLYVPHTKSTQYVCC